MAIDLYSKGSVDSLLSAKLSVSSLSNGATSTLNSTAPTSGQVLSFDGTDLVWATGGGGGSVSWGGISGTLSDQSDLASALGGKADTTSPSFAGTVYVTGSSSVIQIGDSFAGIAVFDGSMSYYSTITSSGVRFPDGTTQSTAATYNDKKAIANLCAACFTTNGSTFGFTNWVALAVAQGSKFQSGSNYVLGIGTPGYGPTSFALSYSSTTYADSGYSWTSASGQTVAYSDDYGTTWTYADLTF